VKSRIEKLSIIGFGNVGSHLAKAFDQHGIHVSHIYARSRELAEKSAGATNSIVVDRIEDLPERQLVILCVPDAAIADVITQISATCPIAYTSGSTDLASLPQRDQLGVFYPLQTFTKAITLDLSQVHIFIESTNDYFASELFDLAWAISRNVNYATSEERKHLHLAAVWVNNFSNHMNHIAHQYLDSKGLNFDHLKPLLLETAQKLQTENPLDAQTGPARRNDSTTIAAHLQELTGDQKEIYRLISKSIQDTYSND
jgi:predicted short-subunit dehydrogenase-like oxidoreductase (DUF2520 family)